MTGDPELISQQRKLGILVELLVGERDEPRGGRDRATGPRKPVCAGRLRYRAASLAPVLRWSWRNAGHAAKGSKPVADVPMTWSTPDCVAT